jgi:hypothetical protein
MKITSRTVEKRLRRLVKRLRSGDLDDPVRGRIHDPDRFEDGELPASRLVDRNPPIGWNYMNGRNWSQKWLISVSLGPWREQRAMGVMHQVLHQFGQRRLSSLRENGRLPFPSLSGDWQWEWTLRVAEYLRLHRLSERVFLGYLKRIDGGGLAARGALRAICGAWGPSKTIDYFVREGLDLEVIPVDRHVERVLAKAGLGSVSQADIIAACHAIGVKPQRLARALYTALSPPGS